MKLLVALCLMAAGVSAQYGQSGIVFPDGRLKQFTREEADNVAEIGESGVVFKDGSHKQFDMEFATLHNNLPAPARPEPVAFGPYSYTGIVMPHGNNRQFTHDEHTNIVLVGPSGVVTADGRNLQLDQEGLPLPLRRKRSVALEGPSGAQFSDGQLVHLPVGVKIVLVGPSGATLSNGNHVQFREKRSPSGAVVGPSGMITPSGQVIQFAPGVSVPVHGPSGAVFSTGKNIQYDRKKRAAPSTAVLGESGIITPSGRPVHLPLGTSVVLHGPSGIVLSTGETIQFDL